MTLAEVLIAFVVLALGLSGVLATFPVGQNLASQCEEYTVSTIIASNNAAVIRGSYPGEEYTTWTTGPVCFEEATTSGIPAAPVFSQFSSNPFKLEIYPVNDTVLHDKTTGHSNYEVSVSRAKSEKGVFELFLIVIHKEGSDRLQHMLLGRGFDNFE